MKKQNGKRPLLVACDTFRPAAIQQLEVVGGQLGVPVFQQGLGDPVEIAKAGIEHARTTATTSCFWIPPAGSMWTTSSWPSSPV